jgi:hypothetical protein
MQGDNGPGMLPALMQLFNAGQLAEDTPRISAVDLACCVARHIPTVEAFVELGVRPSETALQLAEHAVPIMRCAVQLQPRGACWLRGLVAQRRLTSPACLPACLL